MIVTVYKEQEVHFRHLDKGGGVGVGATDVNTDLPWAEKVYLEKII